MRLISPDAIAAITVWQEARGEPSQQSRIAVAEVIRNRMASGWFSDGSVIGTCLRPLQFSGWNAGDPNRVKSMKIDADDPIVADCMSAWETAKAGSDLTLGADSYLNPDALPKLPDWYDPSKITVKIGRHVFLKLR